MRDLECEITGVPREPSRLAVVLLAIVAAILSIRVCLEARHADQLSADGALLRERLDGCELRERMSGNGLYVGDGTSANPLQLRRASDAMPWQVQYSTDRESLLEMLDSGAITPGGSLDVMLGSHQ